MRTLVACLLVVCSFDSFAATIERLDPSSVAANSGATILTLYGSELTGPVVFATSVGDVAAEVVNSGENWISVYIPLEAMMEPGEVKLAAGDATAVLVIAEPRSGPLQIQSGDPIVVEAEGRWGAKVEYDVFVIGGSDPNPKVSCEPASGTVFPLGGTHVRCVATNSFGERAEGGPYVFVADYGVPVVQVPDRIRVQATSEQGAVVEFRASANDVVDGELPVSCDPQSGSQFPIGETTVVCVAVDSNLNYGYGEFVVEVTSEKEVLVLHLPDPITAEATGPDGADVTFEVTADGTSDPDPSVECDPKSGSTFAIGETTVKCVARDSFGNTAEGAFSVTVRDTVAPILTKLVASPDVLPPNGKWEDVKIDVEVLDVVDPMPRCRAVDITTNQPGGGAEITGELTVRVLAERDEKLGDRRYDVRVECTDSSQNVSTGTANVIVPKGKVDESPGAVDPPKEKKAIRMRQK